MRIDIAIFLMFISFFAGYLAHEVFDIIAINEYLNKEVKKNGSK